MFYHNACNHEIMADFSKRIKFIGPLGISNTTLTVGIGTIIEVKGSTEVELFCMHCNIVIPSTDYGKIMGRCFSCGDEKSILDLYKPENAGGYYCKECFSKLFDPKRMIPLIKIFALK